jgi:formate dehydrogenase subunit gamma
MAEKQGKSFYRITLHQRIQHVIILVSFSVLVLTGMPLKFANANWCYPLIKLFGGVFMAGRIHRIAGLIMALEFVYVLAYIILTTAQKAAYVLKRNPAKDFKEVLFTIIKVAYNIPMFPRAKDGIDIADGFKYFLHLSDKKPDYEKFCWKEKFDYLAVFWGIPVFTLTGPLLWFPSFWTNIGIPPIAINVAWIVHSDESFLALVVIMIWHFYNALFCPEKFPMDGLVVSGTMAEHLVADEYPAEYRRIMTEEGENGPSVVRHDE